MQFWMHYCNVKLNSSVFRIITVASFQESYSSSYFRYRIFTGILPFDASFYFVFYKKVEAEEVIITLCRRYFMLLQLQNIWCQLCE